MTAFDRDALEAVHEAFKRGEQWYRVEAMILALVRPVAGVTPTPEAGTATFDDALRDIDNLARVLYEVRESGGWDRAPWADRNYWRGMAAKAIAAGWRHQ